MGWNREVGGLDRKINYYFGNVSISLDHCPKNYHDKINHYTAVHVTERCGYI